MKKKLNKIAKDTNFFLKRFIERQKKSELIIPMKYCLFSGGKKIRSKILIDIGSLFNRMPTRAPARRRRAAPRDDRGAARSCPS